MTIYTLLGRLFCVRVIHQHLDARHLPLFGCGQRADIWRKVCAAVEHKCPHASSCATLLGHMRRGGQGGEHLA